ncbi:MAG: ribosome maturation factor RimP, partial [Pseudomonadota bacterium]
MPLTVPHIDALLQSGAEALGYELVAVEMAGGDNAILRVFIDSKDGVDVEDCAKASRQFSAILDVEDPVSGKYLLEVSSPGIDRPLAKPAHFEAVIGEEIKVRTSTLVEGRRRFKGRLISTDDDGIEIQVDDSIYSLSYLDLDKALRPPNPLPLDPLPPSLLLRLPPRPRPQ